jgi:hypothetical protein
LSYCPLKNIREGDANKVNFFNFYKIQGASINRNRKGIIVRKQHASKKQRISTKLLIIN